MKLILAPLLMIAMSSAALADDLSCSAALLAYGDIAQSKKIALNDDKEKEITLDGNIKVIFQKTAKFKDYVDTRVFEGEKLLLVAITKAVDAHTEILIPQADKQISLSCTQGDAF